MELPFSGRCQCGALRYVCTELPRFAVNCHCKACQKTSGASCVSVLNVPISAVEVSGEVRRSVRTGDSGGKGREWLLREVRIARIQLRGVSDWAHDHHGHEPR